jgi:predicted ATP-grasp superfamily ATP-dependent carboligase
VSAGYDGRPIGTDTRIVADLLQAGRKLGIGSVLISGTDEWAVFVDEHADDLSSVFTFSRPPAGLVARLASKQGLYEIASRCGMPTPRLVVPGSLEEATGMAPTLTYPVMVKPVVSRPDVSAKAVVHSASELLAYVRIHREDGERPNVLFQEYIPGSDADVWMFTGCFDSQSRCVAGFTGQKLRQCPAHMGHTSLGMARPNPRLMAQASAFMTRIGYVGIVDSGFRYDAHDDTYKILDVNPRVGGNFRQFISWTGIDVVRAHYLGLCRIPFAVGEQVDGRRWIKEDSDVIAMMQYRRLGELSFGDWLKSLRHIDEGSTFALDDPLPFARAMSLLLADTVKGRWRRRRRPRSLPTATRAQSTA